MMTKKIMLTLLVLLIVVSTTVALVACKPEGDGFEFDKKLMQIGQSAPTTLETLDDFIEIDESMSATEMMMAAVHNYEQVKYIAVSQTGDVTTSMLGLDIQQAIEGLRIRKDGETYMHNNSITKKAGGLPITIKVLEKYFIDNNSAVKLLSANQKNIVLYDHKLYAKAFDIDKKFASMSEFQKENPNDPSRLFMYIVNEDTIESTTTPVKKDGYYEFEVRCNATDAFEDYLPVMNYMLKGNKGTVTKSTELSFVVQIWEEGVFKHYDVVEQYDIKIAGIFNGGVSLKSDVKFTYDEKEVPWNNYYDSAKDDFVRNLLPEDAKK